MINQKSINITSKALQEEVDWKMDIKHEGEYTLLDALIEIEEFAEEGLLPGSLLKPIREIFIEIGKIKIDKKEEISNKEITRTTQQYQTVANIICEHFKMKIIPVVINKRLRITLGLYRGNRIDLATYAAIKTLYHELAHHLRKTRFNQRVPGYFKTEMARKMIHTRTDENGKQWYSAKGEFERIYYYSDRSHSKLFKKCLVDVQEFVSHIEGKN